MQDQRLYIGEEEYHGFLGARPNIPFGEIWVFAMQNGDYTTATREDNDFIPPPPSPWMKRHAAVIYKLHKQATYTIQQQYLPVSAYPTMISWSVTARVVSPIAYIQSGQFTGDNLTQLSAALIAKVQSDVEQRLVKTLEPVINNPKDLTIPRPKQIFPTSDFTPLVRGSREFRDIGLDVVNLIMNNYQCPAYQKLLDEATTGLQRELSASRIAYIRAATEIDIGRQRFEFGEQQRLIAARNDLEIALLQLGFRKQEAESILGQIEMYKINATLIEKALDQLGQTADPAVAAQLIRQLLASNPNPLQQPSPGMTPGWNPPAQGQLLAGDRDTQIQQLYQAAQKNGWVLFPPQYRGGEMIQVGLKNNRQLELGVPTNYPTQKARIEKATSQGTRLSKTQIDRTVQGVTSGTYNLVSLVEELDNTIK